jgi:16S rRNA (guanine966-N2)-methyltransferase
MPGRKHHETRVIAGTLKGKALRYPGGAKLRPTMQRTKGSVFDSIGDRVVGNVFVDLYAGGGGVGIEALSRGGSRVHFVENDPLALRYLHENLARCGIDPLRGVVHPMAVMEFLRGGALRRFVPNVVYADPPYDADEIRVLLEFFDHIEYALGALLVIEHRRDALTLDPLGRLSVLRRRQFGQSCVSYIALGGNGS